MRDQHLDELAKADPKTHHYISGVWHTLGDGALTAFLLFMSLRLIEMKRVLKPTGSIYLHCDHHASHYLKQLMDIVFGINNFRNEIIWHYQTGGASKRFYAKKHDILLWYTKADNYIFNPSQISFDRTEKAMKRAQNPKGARISESDTKKLPMDVWTDIQALNPMAIERKKAGYPTQKPLALYERIVLASSNEGDLVLDPFCGCATTLVAAESLGRQWIGIDIHPQIRTIVANRIAEACNLNSPDGSMKFLEMERDLDIRIFTKDNFPAQTN